jgi:DNA polymerase
MGADQNIDWQGALASTLEWWRDAGVDTLVDDAPRDWLARNPTPAPAIAPPAPAPIEAPLPDTLDAFVAWRLSSEAPEGARGPAIPPEGQQGAAIAVVIDCPGDTALLGEDEARLFERMLAAIGLTREAVYLASLTTVRPIGGRIPPEQLGQLGDLLRHHLSLAAPRRVLVMGQAASRALLATDDARPPRNLHAVNLNDVTIEVVPSLSLGVLLKKPALKAEAWKDLQLLMGGLR